MVIQRPVSAFKVSNGGKLLPISHGAFRSLAYEPREGIFAIRRRDARTKEDIVLAPAAVMVDADALRSIFQAILNVPHSWAGTMEFDPPVWDEDPSMTPDMRAVVLCGFESLYERRRVDSIANTQEQIKCAFSVLAARAKQAGLTPDLDHQCLPGTKSEFWRLIKIANPNLERYSDATLSDYAKRMGFRWKRGAQRGGAAHLSELLDSGGE